VDDDRSWFAGSTAPRFRRAAEPSGHVCASWLFVRLLGLTYLIAFWSLGRQIVELVGQDGILPADVYLDNVRAAVGTSTGMRLLPTLAWLDASDSFLRATCLAGSLLAAMVAAGLLPAAFLTLLWFAYLSLTIICREFLGYQWDALLLETGLLAIFVAPWKLRHRLGDGYDPPRLGVALIRWLLFRLMFGSGAVKLASGDPTWRGLTALTFHFWTQPIPTPPAWYANQLPLGFLKVSTAAVLLIELAVPLLIFAPRRPRAIACGLMMALQAAIALTGNYAFFNLLAGALCLLLLDDAVFRSLARWFRIPTRWARVLLDPPRAGSEESKSASHRSPEPSFHRTQALALVAVAVITAPLSVSVFAAGIGIDLPGRWMLQPVAAAVEPFRSVNSYGLFAVMTTTRPEIVLEGSEDGTVWLDYEFKYKPTDITRPPPWVAPHQPRLDWQLWFAALSRYEAEPWFQGFCLRLLQGSPGVRRLLARDPFQGRAPRYLRAALFQYRFSDLPTRTETGAWWKRERIGEYSPILTLEDVRAR
jgi:hypothetical protein